MDENNNAESGKHKAKPVLKISSEEEFLTMMEEIDRELSDEGVKVATRPFAMGLRIAERYDITLNACPPRRPPLAGSFEPLEISIRIHDWVEKRYGKKLNVPFHIGRVVMPLRGDCYLINCPLTMGRVKFIFDPKHMGQTGVKIGKNAPAICNLLDLVEDLTPDFACSLTAEEAIQISVSFVNGMGAYSALREVDDVKYVREVVGDFDAAVFHLIEHSPQPGLSKWASLQTVEKMLKAYIATKGGSVEFIHILQKLANEAVKLGLPEPPKEYIEAVQCPAGVRYGQIPVSIDDALKAHQISLNLCEGIARAIGKAMNRQMPIVSEPIFDGMTLSEFIKKYGI
jgi:HEPN domain-containing protein